MLSQPALADWKERSIYRNRHECPTSSSRGSPAIQPGMS
jgi:hypothetical protein